MHIPRPAPLSLAMLMTFAVASPAHAELVKIDWDTTGRFEHAQDVAAGKFAEVCGKLAKDESVRWSFRAAAPLNFNIHYHEGKKVEFPAKQDEVEQMQGTLPVRVGQDYCWMWTNKSAMLVSLRVLLAH